MDSAFVPNAIEFTVKHTVQHNIALHIPATLTSFGREIRNTIIAVVLIKCTCEIVKSVLNSSRRPTDSDTTAREGTGSFD